MIEQVKDETPNSLAGDGSSSNPFLIESIDDLVTFANNVKNGNTYSGLEVKLMYDLDFNSSLSYTDANRENFGGYKGKIKDAILTNGFNPIGTTSNNDKDEYSFAGTFDGNGKEIRNLYISIESNNTSNDLRMGFFGNNNGTITNLGIVNCNISGSLNTTGNNTLIIGAICGYNYGVISNCMVQGKINGEGIENAKCRVGGITGTHGGKIQSCYNKATLTATGKNWVCVGGILGIAQGNSVTEKSYNLGEISSNAISNVANGGIIGYMNSNAILNNCYNCHIINTDMTLADSNSVGYIGGIVGYSQNPSISQIYNISKVNIKNNTSKVWIGSVIGICYRVSNINDIYYLSEIGEKAIGNFANDPENVTKIEKEREMPKILNILGSKFKEDTTYINNGYPILDWQ